VLLMKTKEIAFGAVLSALGIALLWLGGAVPTGRLALVALAAMLPAAAVASFGLPLGFAVYGVTALLALLLLPNKFCTAAYGLVLGWYAPVKSLIERLDRAALEWAVKLVLFAAVSAVLAIMGKKLLAAFLPTLALPSAGLLIPALVVVFVLYDIAFTGVIGFYRTRIAPHL
jgi:hypothetical protein